MVTYPTIKRCPRCDRFLRVVIGETFNKNNSGVTKDRLQIFCRECDERRKATETRYGWSVFERVIAKEGPAVTREWSFDTYLSILSATDYECHWCGAHLARWGKGHNIDRVESTRPHLPDNCVACCSACNWAKGSMSSSAWTVRIAGIMKSYPRGKVPWDAIDPKGPKRANIPDLSEYVVDVQPSLPRIA